VHEVIAETLRATRSGTFLLFTAYGALNRAVQALGPQLQAQGRTLLQQGDTNRHLLLSRFVAVAARGGTVFAEQTMPQAVIKLKQGFGRLIRSRTDRGAVVLLDSRIVRKPYGRVFLDSLRPARRRIGDRRTVAAALRQLFAPDGQS